MSTKHDYYQLHVVAPHGERGAFVVKGYGEYPSHSVNAGMTRVSFLGSYDTELEAREAYPQLGDEDNYGSEFIDADLKHIPSTPPSWFDPSIAGEQWNDDY